MKAIFLCAAAALLLSGGSALALGKVGLWRVTSTTDMAMAMPGEKGGVKPMAMPAAKPYISQMCMSAEEVASNAPPHMDQAASGCDTKLVSRTPMAMTARMTCGGKMKGAGTMSVAYKSAEHYAGSYSFKGAVEGNPVTLKSTFQGDWLKADCGKVQPYRLRTQ